MSYPRSSADLSGYPDLVVIYLGYRVKRVARIASLVRIGRTLRKIDRNRPDGLLGHDYLIYGLFHIGFRQYWRDFESLERFTSGPIHKKLWRDFAADPAGGAIWHETYKLQGGMEAIYSGIDGIGFSAFAPARPPVGSLLTARQRLAVSPPVSEMASPAPVLHGGGQE